VCSDRNIRAPISRVCAPGAQAPRAILDGPFAEEEDELDGFRPSLWARLDPRDALEASHVEGNVRLHIRLHRLARYEDALLEQACRLRPGDEAGSVGPNGASSCSSGRRR
jgi:hypothetical protein